MEGQGTTRDSRHDRGDARLTWRALFAKAVAYRLWGACLTVLTVLLVGGTLELAGVLAAADMLVRTLGYMLFERLWHSR